MKFFLQGTINMKLTQSFAIVFYKWFPSCDEHFQCIWLTWHIITVLPIRIQCLWGTKTKWTWRDEMKIKFRKEMSNEIILYAGVQIEQFSKPQLQHQLWNWLYLYTSSSFYTATTRKTLIHGPIICGALSFGAPRISIRGALNTGAPQISSYPWRTVESMRHG
jgi:hypothetical protein